MAIAGGLPFPGSYLPGMRAFVGRGQCGFGEMEGDDFLYGIQGQVD